MSTEGLEAELAVHEDDGVACFEEVFGGRCASGSCRKLDMRVWRNGCEEICLVPALKLSRNRTLCHRNVAMQRSTDEIRTDDFSHGHD